MSIENRVDCLTPQEMAEKAEATGVRKASLSFSPLFVLAILAGAFVGLGAMFATTVAAGASSLPYGVMRLLMGMAFCLGLILVVVGGAELFTGNNLLVMAWASHKISLGALLRNWLIVYLGNLVGSVLIAFLVFIARQYTYGQGAVGGVALNIAVSKIHPDILQAVALGVLCNMMVCLAIWLTYSAKTVSGKILAIIFPITAFVAAGFEHSVANMYFLPYALMIKGFDPAFAASTKVNLTGLTWSSSLLNNLLPVTLGNIIGGAVFVGAMYWFIYLRKKEKTIGK
jgi:formate transporter